jgi:hypothetical protein
MTAAPTWLLLRARRTNSSSRVWAHKSCSLLSFSGTKQSSMYNKLQIERGKESDVCVYAPSEREKESRGRRAIDFVSSGRVCELVSARGLFMARF